MAKNIEKGSDLRTIVTMRAWQDKAFAEKVKADPKKAVKELADELGLEVPDDVDFKVVNDSGKTYHLVLADNPVGASPEGLVREAGGGTVNSYTADCGCSDTYTGGCSCGSVFGTPCLACGTVILC